MAGELDLHIRLLHDAVNANVPQQLAYVLLDANPTGAQIQGVQAPLNLALVLDRSGSMNGAKIHNLREATKLLIQHMQPTDYVSIITFDDQVDVLVSAQSAQNIAQLMQVVDSIQDRGGTQISLGLQQAIDQVRRNFDPGRVNKIVLLTDGNSWGDEAACQALAQQAGQQNIPIVALGLGLVNVAPAAPGMPAVMGMSDDWNHALLDGLGNISGGMSELIQTPQEIAKVFQDILKSSQATVVRNAELTLRLVQDVMPRQVWQTLPLISNLSQRAISAREIQISLGDIDKTTGKQILAELILPPKPMGKNRIAQAEIMYDVPAFGLTQQIVRTDIIIEYGAESPINPQVMNIVERVSAHKLQTQALSDAQAGNVAGATQKLKAAATRLLNIGESQLAQDAMQEADNLQQQGQMSSAGTKRLNYGTRKLTQQLDPNAGNPPQQP
ncbi:MAG: VWA domain-containing protein [Chloroflexota bacterium]|nr:MAG: VWA domain-containing protein [Chloroflexota bacterium]